MKQCGRFFLYHPDAGTAFFDTEAEALEHARLWIEDERPPVDDVWPSGVAEIVVGRVTHRAQETHIQRPIGVVDDETGEDEEGVHWGSGIDYRCDMAMLPLPEETRL